MRLPYLGLFSRVVIYQRPTDALEQIMAHFLQKKLIEGSDTQQFSANYRKTSDAEKVGFDSHNRTV